MEILKIDPNDAKILEICGIRYDMGVFEALGLSLIIGTRFQFIWREDGVVTIKRIEEQP